MSITITIQTGPAAGRALTLQRDQSGFIGRASFADLSVADPMVSGRHFALEWAGNKCIVRDLGSMHGTFLNGERLASMRPIRDGDVLRAGQSTFAVRYADEPDSEPIEDVLVTRHMTVAPPERTRPPEEPVMPADAPFDCVVVEVAEGAEVGSRLVIQSGESGLVGRASWAKLRVHDPDISGEQFSLEYRGGACHLRDLNSRNGTYVNGKRVSESNIADGDRITAGQTVFRVRLESDSVPTLMEIDLGRERAAWANPIVPPVAAVEPLPERTKPAPRPKTPTAVDMDLPELEANPTDNLLSYFRSIGEPLFVLLDAARDPRVLQMLAESGAHHQSLYEGPQGDVLAQWAPYLAEVENKGKLLECLVRDGWSNSWGVFLTSAHPLAEVRKHFRKLLLVQLPDGREAYFRFYDPRVLRVYFPTCTPEQTQFFFGVVSSYLMETNVGDTILRFTPSGFGVKKEVIAMWLKGGKVIEASG